MTQGTKTTTSTSSCENDNHENDPTAQRNIDTVERYDHDELTQELGNEGIDDEEAETIASLLLQERDLSQLIIEETDDDQESVRSRISSVIFDDVSPSNPLENREFGRPATSATIQSITRVSDVNRFKPTKEMVTAQKQSEKYIEFHRPYEEHELNTPTTDNAIVEFKSEYGDVFFISFPWPDTESKTTVSDDHPFINFLQQCGVPLESYADIRGVTVPITTKVIDFPSNRMGYSHTLVTAPKNGLGWKLLYGLQRLGTRTGIVTKYEHQSRYTYKTISEQTWEYTWFGKVFVATITPLLFLLGVTAASAAEQLALTIPIMVLTASITGILGVHSLSTYLGFFGKIKDVTANILFPSK